VGLLQIKHGKANYKNERYYLSLGPTKDLLGDPLLKKTLLTANHPIILNAS